MEAGRTDPGEIHCIHLLTREKKVSVHPSHWVLNPLVFGQTHLEICGICPKKSGTTTVTRKWRCSAKQSWRFSGKNHQGGALPDIGW